MPSPARDFVEGKPLASEETGSCPPTHGVRNPLRTGFFALPVGQGQGLSQSDDTARASAQAPKQALSGLTEGDPVRGAPRTSGGDPTHPRGGQGP